MMVIGLDAGNVPAVVIFSGVPAFSTVVQAEFEYTV